MRVESHSSEGKSPWEQLVQKSAGDNWSPLVIFVPVRLGLDSMNPQYYAGLKQCLQLPQSLGFVGGRPRSSLYFLGYQGDRLLYLDPHTIQQSVPIKERLRAHSSSFHCGRIRTLKFEELDPSMCFGFYCRDRDEFLSFWASVESIGLNRFPPVRTALKAPTYEEFDLDLEDDDLASPNSNDERSLSLGLGLGSDSGSQNLNNGGDAAAKAAKAATAEFAAIIMAEEAESQNSHGNNSSADGQGSSETKTDVRKNERKRDTTAPRGEGGGASTTTPKVVSRKSSKQSMDDGFVLI